jgi:hypothetical protein
LWKRHKKAEEIYYDALEECEKAHEKLDEMENTLDNPFHLIKYEDAYDAAYKKDYTTFRELVEIEKAILWCRIVTQKLDWEKWIQMDYNIKLFHYGLTPFTVELRKNPEYVVVEYEESDSSDWDSSDEE